MHYLGIVFVDKPTQEAVEDVMRPHVDTYWDWYRCGGRWDGYLLGSKEMKARETHNGFNFEDKNNDVSRNNCLAKDFPPEVNPPFFFVSDGEWVEKEYFEAVKDEELRFGSLLPTPNFAERWKEALQKNESKYTVVVDVHN